MLPDFAQAHKEELVEGCPVVILHHPTVKLEHFKKRSIHYAICSVQYFIIGRNPHISFISMSSLEKKSKC